MKNNKQTTTTTTEVILARWIELCNKKNWNEIKWKNWVHHQQQQQQDS